MNEFLAWFYWNPPREAFTIPIIDRPVMWYGVLFVAGLIMAYFMIIPIFQRALEKNHPLTAKKDSTFLADKMVWYAIIGILVGARLGEVFFYEWPRYQAHPLDIFKIWEGGLASHGGTVGMLIAMFLYHRNIVKKFPEISFISLIDIVCIPTGIVIVCIRLGNFFNQEIIGNETMVPWAIIFGNAADGSIPVPRHPTQLYEALAYLVIFISLYFLWRFRGANLKPGTISGLFFIGVFGSRFIIEFWKTPLSMMINENTLHMGQYLSIPFILLGIGLLAFKPASSKNSTIT